MFTELLTYVHNYWQLAAATMFGELSTRPTVVEAWSMLYRCVHILTIGINQFFTEFVTISLKEITHQYIPGFQQSQPSLSPVATSCEGVHATDVITRLK